MTATTRLFPEGGATSTRRAGLSDEATLILPPRPPPLFSTGGRPLPPRAARIADEEQLLREASRDLLEDLNTLMPCFICNTLYKTIDNFATWSCAYHPGELMMQYGYTHYSCCGRARDQAGCVACMHVSNPENYYRIKRTPLTAVVEIQQALVDFGIILVRREMFARGGRPTITATRTYVVNDLGQPLDDITPEDRVYQLHMVRQRPAH